MKTMKTALLLTAIILAMTANVAFAEMPAPGKQVTQTIELPAMTTKRPPMPTQEELDANTAREAARLNALPPAQRIVEIRERELRRFEEIQNAKPLSETEKQTLSYWLFLPNSYVAKTEKKYPLLLFLHGIGESGSDIEKVKAHGPPKLLSDPDKAKDWQFITVSPQCPDDYDWSPLQLALLLDELEKKYEVDKDRIYVTGMSMGGRGAWGLLYHSPDRFAAGVPIASSFHIAAADRFVNLPLWIFYGEKDIAVNNVKREVEAIKSAGGKQVQLTVHPDVGHDAWTITYDDPVVYRWLLQQIRKNN
jgi:predicted peptidase